jgi:tRNA threonylcarbamoyl adenosine modification protein (Sua5/YciO/YrdC/YwlC family)
MFDTTAQRLLQPGAVGVIPTDTVYGLVARAADPVAVARLYALKDREHKPGTIIAASIDQLVTLGIKRRYVTSIADFWPGAVSVIIPCGAEMDYLKLGQDGLAVRLPKGENLQKLLLGTGPLLTTSANLPAEPTSKTIAEAKQYFGDRVDFYVDGGDLSANLPSTIIRVIDDAIEIVREGAVKIDTAE